MTRKVIVCRAIPELRDMLRAALACAVDPG